MRFRSAITKTLRADDVATAENYNTISNARFWIELRWKRVDADVSEFQNMEFEEVTMSKLIQLLGMAAIISTAGAASAFAGDVGWHHIGGGSAPAPAIGASALGMFLASGIAFYVRRRRGK